MQDKGNDARTTLRTVMLGTNLSNGTQAIKSTVTDVLSGIPTNSSGGELAKITAVAALETAKKGYDAVTAYNAATKTDTDLFDQDYHAGTVTCFLPTKDGDRKEYQKFLANFLHLFQEGDQGFNSPLMRRAGISYTENVSKAPPAFMFSSPVQGTSFSVISAAKVVFAGLYSSARKEDLILDTARNGSDLLLRAKLRSCLAKIYSRKNDSLATKTWSGESIHPTLHLYHLDILRFIILVFSNLLINAQHPAKLDIYSATPLSAQEAEALCALIKSKINKILVYDKKDPKSPWAYLNSIQERDMIFDFLALINREFEELQEGYQSKILNQLDLNELTEQAQGGLQELNDLWHQIIYLDKPGTEAVCLVYLVRELSNALDDHPDFWKILPNLFIEAKLAMPVIPELQQPYGTVMDALGLIFSLNRAQRQSLLDVMKTEFPNIRRCLKQINQEFVLSLEGLEAIQDRPSQSFLMALVAVSTESYEPFIQEPKRGSGQLSLKRQIENLNTLQIKQTDPNTLTFKWDILNYFADQAPGSEKKATPSKKRLKSLSTATLQSLKAVVRSEYEFLDNLRMVYSLQSFLENNKKELLNKSVIEIVKKVLNTFLSKTNGFIHSMGQLYTQVDMQDKINPDENDLGSNQRRQFIIETLSDKPAGEAISEENISSNKQALHRIKHTRTLITAALERISTDNFSRDLEQNLVDQVDAFIFASHDEFLAQRDLLLTELQLPVQPQVSNLEPRPSQTIGVKAPISTEAKVTQTETNEEHRQEVPPPSNVSPASNHSTRPSQNLNLLLILRIMRAVSAFLLIVGILVLLSLTYGAPYIPIIAALTAQQMSLGMVLGGMSTVVGTVGLALSHFFKPRAVVESPSSTPTTEVRPN